MNNLLVIGSGARELAIIEKCYKDLNTDDSNNNLNTDVSNNNLNNNFFYISNVNNVFIDKYASYINIPDYTSNSAQIMAYCKEYSVNSVIIGPESLLITDLVEQLESINIQVFAPNKYLAKIETDKGFLRKLFNTTNYDMFIPKYTILDSTNFSEDSLKKILNDLNDDYVIKANGLNGGKGVKLSGVDLESFTDTLEYCREILSKNQTIVVEEKLYGEEFSYHSLVRNGLCLHTFPIKDYKKLNEDDTGPNTGSMGCVSDTLNGLPYLTKYDITLAKQLNELAISLVQSYYDDKYLYNGVIYGSYIKTRDNKIKIIEYNARFGDPEALILLNNMTDNLYNLCFKPLPENFNPIIHTNNNVSMVKYIVPIGYPNTRNTTDIIDLILLNEYSEIINFSIYIANITRIITPNSSPISNNLFRFNGSRGLALYMSGNCMEGVRNKLNYILTNLQHFFNNKFHFRGDIPIFNSDLFILDTTPMDYKQAGVDVDKGNKIVEDISEYVRRTHTPNVLSKIGDYSGILGLNLETELDNNKNNCGLVSTIDGVGTKTSFLPKLLPPNEAYYIMGQDIVNHGVNDILVKGATPLMFLDYIASSKLEPEIVSTIILGMSDALIRHNCPLMGGETAEMPDVYNDNSYDIVGTMIGKINEENIIDGKRDVSIGNIIIGLPSVSPHTNGYTLIRKLFEKYSYDIHNSVFDEEFLTWITRPHKSYYNEINTLLSNGIKINALCHVTGGGFIENPIRVIPDSIGIDFYTDKIMDTNFNYLQQLLGISDYSMFKTFNCGIGMLVFINDDIIEKTLHTLEENGINYRIVGITKETTLNDRIRLI